MRSTARRKTSGLTVFTWFLIALIWQFVLWCSLLTFLLVHGEL